jgi:hypothetical protein
MGKRTQYYAEYMYPGLLVAETQTVPIGDPNHVDAPDAPVSSVGYRTFARTIAVVDGEECRGEPRDHSPWTYFGKEMTLADVKRERPNERILISNMHGNGYARVVMTNAGATYPLRDDDRVASR